MRGDGYRISKYFRNVKRKFDEEMMKAEIENARTILDSILQFSSGDISEAELAEMGHPYAWGRVPPQDPAIINEQTGLFLQSWNQDGPRFLPDGSIYTRFWNSAPYAEFLSRKDGTVFMIPRPLDDAVKRETDSIVRARRREALKRAISEGGLR